MINVTKTFLPPFEEYSSQVKRAWDKSWITNNGELVQELEQKLKEYLGVKHLFFCCNGTIVLQMALKALGITKEVITTPYSYVATSNAILWEGCTPVFVDIEPDTFCIDASKIEEAITEDTEAIMATHVYGLPCNIETIQKIADKHKLKIIYDGAHSFGCTYRNKSLLSYGDISTCSFHATKIFHTVEGGCIICHDDQLANDLMLIRQFGHIGDDYYSIGINGKNSEMHAAMGLAVYPHLQSIMYARGVIIERYRKAFSHMQVYSPVTNPVDHLKWNNSYYPLLFESENDMMRAKTALFENGINTRRYFYPSLNNLKFFTSTTDCRNSENISSRVLALPLYHGLDETTQAKVIKIVSEIIR